MEVSVKRAHKMLGLCAAQIVALIPISAHLHNETQSCVVGIWGLVLGLGAIATGALGGILVAEDL